MTPLPLQPTLFTARGDTFQPARDGARLSLLYDRCLEYALAHEWITLRELADNCGGSESSCSARLRDMRTRGWLVERRYVANGLHIYKVTTAQRGSLPEPATAGGRPDAVDLSNPRKVNGT